MALSNKRAFSLTELLIVLVVIAVLFAAIAPILTKRRAGSGAANESVWYYVNNDDQMDSYYDPGVPGWTSTAFIGADPSKITNYSPFAKVVIKASEKVSGNNVHQRQIQFRYGTGNGQNAGSLFIDGDRGSNIMLAFDNNKFVNSTGSAGTVFNTVAGPGAFGNIKKSTAAVAFGANAVKAQTNSSGFDFGSSPSIIAIGNKVLSNASFSNYGPDNVNTFIGASSGQAENNSQKGFTRNIAIGANSLGSPNYYGSNNIYIGYLTGNGRGDNNEGNVIAGSTMTGGDLKNNVVIGYDSYLGGASGIHNLTSIGYQACSSMTSSVTGPRTCIGYKSGAQRASGDKTPSEHTTDNGEHIYLGGIPEGGFSGRGVVEVHNITNPSFGYEVVLKPTVIFNSNLVVRGNLYLNQRFINAKGVELLVYDYCEDNRPGFVHLGDRCQRWGRLFGRKKWYKVLFGGHGGGTPHKSEYMFSNDKNNWCEFNESTYSFSSCAGKVPSLSSDMRLKENITEYDGGFEEISALIPYNYTFKSDKEKRPQVGVIAQDLQKIFPTAVFEGKDGYLRIRRDEIFYGLINSIKALSVMVEKLASGITSVESDIKQLKTKNKDIKKRIASLNARAAKLERK